MNTGGPAFPQHGWSKDPEVLRRMQHQGGMTLLDWYAGQALAGLCANPGGPIQANGSTGWGFTNCDHLYVVGLSYDLSSAMLAEKARREADHSGDVNKMVPNHSPDAGKMEELQAANRELVDALEKVLNCIQETRGPNAYWVVRDARAILAKHKGVA